MARQHVVKQGECLSTIARVYGFADYHPIWDDLQNAPLKAKRGNPDVLFPGDRLFIPDKGGREESADTGRRHRFAVQRARVRLELAIHFDSEPVRAAAYTLRVGNQLFRGQTDAAGVLREEIDARTTYGRLRIEDPPLEWDLAIGHLDPATEVSGAQQRLNNLDHPCGEADGIPGPRTRAALRQFQSRHGLQVTGALDGPTRAALRNVHDGG
jgi:hypothetical protein